MERRGEVKIEREWRQRCSRDLHHGEADLRYPDLVEDGGAAWVMERLRNSAANRSIGSTTGCTILEKAPTQNGKGSLVSIVS